MMNLPIKNNTDLEIKRLKQINTELREDIECILPAKAMLEYISNTYKTLFNTNPDPIALIRISDGRLLEANQRFETLLGYTKDEFHELGIECILNKDAKRIKKMVKKALRNEGWFKVYSKLLSQDKNLIPVEITASLIKLDEQTLVQASIRRTQDK